jgi:Transcription factor WhiB
VTAVVRADLTAAQLEDLRRRDREATRRRRAIARGLSDPGPVRVSDWYLEEQRLRLSEGSPVLGTWILRAACGGEDPELWFSPDLADVSKAQTICARCPVRAQCAAAADANAEPYGVWGGTDREQARRAS